VKFQGIKTKAHVFMEAIAADRGLSRAELEDRIVPDLDLDGQGSRVFDFGPRKFRVVLGPDLVPLVQDEAGKRKADLPRPGAKDDPARAGPADAAWKLLKKQLRETAKLQAARLEQAMVAGRRWPVGQFEALLVRHPLITNLARLLLWGAYTAGTRTATFRVTEEQTYADADDRPFALEGPVTVGIVHPLHLREEEKTKWGEVFGDYEILPPFPQLGRRVYVLTDAEPTETNIKRIAGVRIPPMAVRGNLEKLGWSRGGCDGGVIRGYFKPFPGAGVTAFVEVDPGIPLGNPDWAGLQCVPRAYFLAGLDAPSGLVLPLEGIDPVALSEVLGDLALLASKGQ
jgi:hypothetical protein